MALSNPAAAARHGSSTPLGIVTMCAGVFCLSVSDACAKWLGEHYSTVQIIFSRTLLGLVLVALLAFALNGRNALGTSHLVPNLGRGVIATGAAFCFIFGVTTVPLAKATAIVFAAPVFVALLSWPLLREKVPALRWVAILVGFAGVLVIVRPDASGFEPGALVLVGAALCFALLMMTARMMPRGESIWAMTFYITLVPLITSTVLLPWFWHMPQPEHLPVFLGIGIAGTSGVFFISQAFRLGPAAVLAPFDYVSLVWATALGWLFWNEVPGPWVYVGAGAIVLSGAYLAYREARDDGIPFSTDFAVHGERRDNDG